MVMWQFLCMTGIAFVLLEIFTPSLFFLNFALAAFILAAISIYIKTVSILVIIFFVLSFLSFAFLRPILINRNKVDDKTGLEGKYIGKIAKVSEEVSQYKGVITIYGERWEARTLDKSIIEKDSEVKIIKNDSLVMYVEKINN